MKETTDIWLASFLRMKGHRVHDYQKIKPNRVRFMFDIPEDEWKRLKLEFDKSEISDIKHHQTALIDLAH